MDIIMGIVNWVTANYQNAIVAINALLAALIAVCLLIPGSEPEGFLQKIVDFLAKFSKK